ncbi:MAG TPA: hypothetical protein VKT77_17980 [Chthonomonadaceae bacterium]|nr:hypothetical protein [Chthonomonadaceae bacterium]
MSLRLWVQMEAIPHFNYGVEGGGAGQGQRILRIQGFQGVCDEAEAKRTGASALHQAVRSKQEVVRPNPAQLEAVPYKAIVVDRARLGNANSRRDAANILDQHVLRNAGRMHGDKGYAAPREPVA